MFDLMNNVFALMLFSSVGYPQLEQYLEMVS